MSTYLQLEYLQADQENCMNVTAKYTFHSQAIL